jgi:hypothetical protein
VRAAADLVERGHDIQEGITLPLGHRHFKSSPARHHLFEHSRQGPSRHFVAPGRRSEHRREADAKEAERNEVLEHLAQIDVARGNSGLLSGVFSRSTWGSLAE